jgi:hypothetical protein
MNRYFVIVIVAVAVIAALVFQLPAEIAVRAEPVTAAQPDFGPRPIVVAADERLFTLYAARNAAGFDAEYDGMSMHPLRQRIRTALAKRVIPSLDRLRAIFSQVSDYDLVTWALQRGAAPDFGRAEKDWTIRNSAAPFYGLDSALRDFHREADVPGLWASVAAEYNAEVARWQPLAEDSLHNLAGYLRLSRFPFQQVVILPNFLDSYYSGYGPQIGGIAYVVAGPTETDRSLRGLIEHEIAHSLVGPLVDENLSVVPSAQSERLFSTLKRTMPSGYGTWAGALEETLIRAINQRMINDKALRAKMIDQLERDGFLLIRPLTTALEDYEQSDLPFDQYLPSLLETLNTVQLPAGR